VRRSAALQPEPALDFITFEALVQLGWRMSVRGLQLLVVVAYALAIPAVAVVAVAGAALTRAALEIDGAQLADRAWIVVVTLALLNAYLAATYWFRETFSKRRFAVGGSPNAGFLRALDVSAVSVFTAACAVRTAIVFSLATVATLGVVVVFVGTIEPALAAALALMPVASGLGLLAISARYAARNMLVTPRIRARYAAVAIPAVAIPGYLAAQVASAAAGTVQRERWALVRSSSERACRGRRSR
jgi:hypothetical protein